MEHLDPKDDSPLAVFYTERYAHPDLIKRKQEKSSSNRVRGGIKRSELRPAYDYYALGISLLEVLNEIAAIRPHAIPQLPLYRSLHFLATRLLDGENRSEKKDNVYPSASQVFPSLRKTDYLTLCYTNLSDVSRDLDKERGRWNVEDRVPELATYSKDIVRVVPAFNTVFTPRLRNVIEHPLVARLKYVTQLGLVSLVYPTADHSRYDHAIGSYTYTTNYVKSLFNDLGNPIFRNLVGSEDFNAVLLASLLHDLGQYPLAHDLEEVHDRIFKHTKMGIDFLEDPTPDRHGRTLLQIIEDLKNGWGVSETALLQIYGAHSRNVGLKLKSGADIQATPGRSLKTDVLAAIIDGPVDADKADYIVRDSHRCELPYGNQLDLERLLRVLTVAIMPEEASDFKRVTLGVYDKGVVSAHAFGQARYQLLATVYWHHTVRITKAMLQYATAIGLPLEVFGPETDSRKQIELEIRERLKAFVRSLIPPFDFSKQEPLAASKKAPAMDMGATPPEQVVDIISENEENPPPAERTTTEWYPGIAWTDWLMLRWIAQLPNASVISKSLIYGLQMRRLYKRIAALSRNGSYHALVQRLDELSWPDRIELCKKLSMRIRDKLRRDWGSLDTATFMTKNDFDILCESHLLVLIDIPQPRKKVGYDRPLGVVPELREKSYQQDTRQAFEDKGWREGMEKMIEAIAPVRVLCHPEVRNLIAVSYAPPEENIVKELRALIGD